jgi:hypothetical protein
VNKDEPTLWRHRQKRKGLLNRHYQQQWFLDSQGDWGLEPTDRNLVSFAVEGILKKIPLPE